MSKYNILILESFLIFMLSNLICEICKYVMHVFTFICDYSYIWLFIYMWLFCIILQVDSVMKIHCAYYFNNGCALITDHHEHGTLLVSSFFIVLSLIHYCFLVVLISLIQYSFIMDLTFFIIPISIQ